MSLKYVAVLGCTLTFENPSHSGSISIITPPSLNTFVDNKGVYAGVLNISISDGTDGTVEESIGTGTITPTAIYSYIDGNLVIRVDDESNTITMNGTIPGTPPVAGSYTTKVKISNANQNNTEAE